MASPLFVIESAVRHYIQLWHCGLCPRLSLDTTENGDITVNSSVTFSTPTYQNEYFTIRNILLQWHNDCDVTDCPLYFD